MEKLPIEMIGYIMRFLHRQDIKSCVLVCKKWYAALEDPLVKSRWVCKLYMHDDSEKCLEVANCAGRRFIPTLAIIDPFKPRKGPLQLCKGIDFFCEKRLNWGDISYSFRTISSIFLINTFPHRVLFEEIILKMATVFTNVKIVEWRDICFLDMLDNTSKLEEVLSALDKIPQLHIKLTNENPSKNLRLLNFNLKIHTFRIPHGYSFSEFSVLSSLCTKFKSTVKANNFRVEQPNLNLSEIFAEVTAVTRIFKIKTLSLDLPSISEDDSSCLHQISALYISHLYVSSNSYVHNWLSKEFLPNVILKCKSLRKIDCFGMFDRLTVEQIFSYCPITESVGVTVKDEKCEQLQVRFRRAYNDHSRTVSVTNNKTNNPKLSFSIFIITVPSELREIDLTVVDDFNYCPTVTDILTKISDRCPKIRKFQTHVLSCSRYGKTDISPLTDIEMLEELHLYSCWDKKWALIIGQNISFSCLTKLAVSSFSFKRSTLAEVARACQKLKRLWIMDSEFCYDNLREALILLNNLEELHLVGTGFTYIPILQALYRYPPSFRKLVLRPSYSERKLSLEAAQQKIRIYRDEHPDVMLVIAEAWSNVIT